MQSGEFEREVGPGVVATMDGIPTEHIEALGKLGELHDKALKLIEVQSKTDSIAHPHLSLVAGIQIFHDIVSKLNMLIEEADSKYILPKITPKIKTVLGNLWCEIGTTNLDLEEPGIEKPFRNALEYLQVDPLDPSHIISLIITLNNLGLVFSDRGNIVLSQEYLERAEMLYNNFVRLSVDPVEIRHMFYVGRPISSSEVSDAKERLETSHTLTLYYLAQVYGKLGNHLKAAVYCHSTLKRQLGMKQFDSIDWALNAATLSQYFAEKNRFPEARHHLCAASYILDKYESDMKFEESDDEELKAKEERFNHRRADVARCWVKYGILLLNYSRDRLMRAAEEDDESSAAALCEGSDGEKSQLWFDTLDLTGYESRMFDQYALVFEDARKIFISAQDWVNKGKTYYSLEDHASDYAEIVRDHSELYRALTFFEENDARRCCMHKRRIDLLESLVKELNPQFYTNVCRQLYYELAQTYSEILAVKLDLVKASNERPTQHALKKINSLAEESIKNYSAFLDTIKDPGTKEMPMKIPEELVRPALLSFFHMGRLYQHTAGTDKASQIENTQRNADAYNYIVDYCAANEDAAKLMSAELGVVKEMVQLLPYKIQKLVRDTL